MPITGKLLGALIGSLGGPLGTLLGGFIGHLFDRASEERGYIGATMDARAAAASGFDSVSQAQINFLTCLIGLSLAVAEVDGPIKTSHVEALKRFFRTQFTFSPADHELVQRLIDEMYRNRDRIDVQGLCSYYAAVSSPDGRFLLLRLLFQIARADAAGISGSEEELIRRISITLGLGEQGFRRARAEFVHETGRSYELLGVSPQASVEEIKAAYRRHMLENHPDRVASLGPEFVKVAEEKFKAVQEAYEEIRREKGF